MEKQENTSSAACRFESKDTILTVVLALHITEDIFAALAAWPWLQ